MCSIFGKWLKTLPLVDLNLVSEIVTWWVCSKTSSQPLYRDVFIHMFRVFKVEDDDKLPFEIINLRHLYAVLLLTWCAVCWELRSPLEEKQNMSCPYNILWIKRERRDSCTIFFYTAFRQCYLEVDRSTSMVI